MFESSAVEGDVAVADDETAVEGAAVDGCDGFDAEAGAAVVTVDRDSVVEDSAVERDAVDVAEQYQ